MSAHSGDLSLSISYGDASFSAQGDVSVVLDAYKDFKNLIGSNEPPKEDAPAAAPKSSKSSTAQPSSGSTDLPLKPFLSELDLKGNKEKATAIVAWAAASDTQNVLTIGEIEKLWKKAPFKAPSNLRRDVRTAETEGWLHREGKAGSPDATYQVTGYGQQIIEGWKAPPSS